MIVFLVAEEFVVVDKSNFLFRMSVLKVRGKERGGGIINQKKGLREDLLCRREREKYWKEKGTTHTEQGDYS